MANLYPGIAFSPPTTLTDNIGEADTIIKVADSSVFPPAPNYATIGTDENGETILYAAKAEGLLSGCQRGIEGTAKAWRSGEVIARNFTAEDHNDVIDAVAAAQSTADTAQSAAAAAQSTANQAISDAATAQSTADAALPKSGGVMTGDISFDANLDKLHKISYNILSSGDSVFFGRKGYIIDILALNDVLTVAEYEPVKIRGVDTPYYNTDAANKLYVDSNRPNRNLLDNWYFADPINQRGLTEYLDGYSIDRWIISANKVTLHPDCVTLHSAAQYGVFFLQKFEDSAARQLAGKTVTLSALLKNNTALTSIMFYTNGNWAMGSDCAGFGVTSVTYTVPSDVSSLYIQFGANAAGISEIVAAKLELGSQQTLARKEGDTWVLNDPPPDKALELLKCQRYYYKSNIDGEYGIIKNEIWNIPGESIHYSNGVRFPIRMRIPPAITFFSGKHHTIGKVAYGRDGEDAIATPNAMFVGVDGIGQINLIGEDSALTGNQIAFFYEADANL